MPTSVHNSQTSPIARRSGALAAARARPARHASAPATSPGTGPTTGAPPCSLAGMQRRGLALRAAPRGRAAQAADRRPRRAGDGRAVVGGRAGARRRAARCPAASSRCSSATAAPARSSSRRARRAARRAAKAARDALRSTPRARQARARALLDEHRQRDRDPPPRDRGAEVGADRRQLPVARARARSTASPRRASLGNGALLLWHGEPGTGKTHALRALVRSWRDWCSAHSRHRSRALPRGHELPHGRRDRRAAARTSPPGGSSCSRTPASSCPRPRARTPGRGCRAS